MDYGVTIERAVGEWVWRAEVRHLTPEENKGRHGVYIDSWDANEVRPKAWEPGRMVSYKRSYAAPVEWRPLDKVGPLELSHGMIDLYPNDTVTVQIRDAVSDIVKDLHTRHPDERGPNGEIWNSYGHHSFKVTFRLTQGAVLPPVVVPPTLTIEQEIELLKTRVTALESR